MFVGMIRRSLLAALVVVALAPSGAHAQGGPPGPGPRRPPARGPSGGPGPGGRTRPPLPEPGEARASSAAQLRRLFGGPPRADDLARALGDASTGASPASARSRGALATTLAEALADRPITPALAERTAEALAIAGNADGLTPGARERARTGFLEALAAAGVSEAVRLRVAAAYDQVVSEQLEESVRALVEDLHDLLAGSEVTPEQLARLAASLGALAASGEQPSAESVNALLEDLSAALANKSVSRREAAELVHDLRAVMRSAGASDAEAQAALDAARDVLAASNVDRSDVEEIVRDLEAIRASARRRSR